MIRAFIILAIVGLAAALYLNSIEVVPAKYRELLHKEVFDYLSGLTEADEAVIEDITKNYANKSEDEALAALKEKSPELGARAQEVHLFIKGKVDALGDEAKGFTKEVIGGYRKFRADVANGKISSVPDLKKYFPSIILKYKALSDDAKADLQKQLPLLAAVFKDEKFQKLAQTFLDKDN